MAIPCPACTKPGQTGPACHRCGCDLSALHRVSEAAENCLAQAANSLRRADWSAALTGAERAWRLCHTVDAARIAFLAAGALGQTAQALRWRRVARNAS